MVQGAHLPARDREPAHVEELDLGQRPAVRRRQYVEGSRALHLVAVELAPPRRVHGGALVALDRHVVAAGLGVVLHPVVGGGTSDEAHAVFVEEEEDPVADHVAVVVAGDELLGLVHREVLEGVHAERGEQPDHVGALDVEVGHVVRLVEEGARSRARRPARLASSRTRPAPPGRRTVRSASYGPARRGYRLREASPRGSASSLLLPTRKGRSFGPRRTQSIPRNSAA